MVGGTATRARAQQPYPYPPPQYPYPQPQYPYPQYPQTPATPSGGAPSQPVVLPAYRPPVITLAQPTEGAALPDDKPIVVFRFASAEPMDPLDALSLSVLVDGSDVTSLFQATPSEAWGRLAEAGRLLGTGEHQVSARICSSHGTCGVTKATVNVVSTSSVLQAAATAATSKGSTRKRHILDAVLQAVRVLIH